MVNRFEGFVEENGLWDQAIEIAGQSMVTDLMLASRVSEQLGSAGHEAFLGANLANLRRLVRGLKQAGVPLD